MSNDIGVVCGACDGFNALGIVACVSCGGALSLLSQGKTAEADRPDLADTQPKPDQAAAKPVADEAPAQRAAPQLSEEELMEQARNYVCRECSTPVPSGHKFCGTCG